MEQAIRHNEGKLQWSLVDFKSLEDMVRVLEKGVPQYGRSNWKKGTEVHKLCESLLRHTFAFMSGEDNDPTSGLPHIGHIQANAMFIAHVIKNKPELDTR